MNEIVFRERPSIFYGWWIVTAVFFIALYISGVIYWGFTAVIEPISAEMGWSYGQISLAISLRGLETSLLAPVVGVFTDRFGPRKLTFLGSFVAFVGLIALARTQSLLSFYVAFFVISIGLSACTTTVLMTAVNNWFKRRAGLASGVAACGFGFGGLLVSLIVYLIELYGWRTAVTIIGAGMFLVVMPLSLVLRHKPEQYGDVCDGCLNGPVSPNEKAKEEPGIGTCGNVGQALKSAIFWKISLAMFCHPLLAAAVVTHVMPYLGSVGVTRYMASLVATAIPLVSIFGRLGLGWLSDKGDKRKVTAGAFAALGTGMLFFAITTKTVIWALIPFLIFFSIALGGLVTIRVSLLSDYFGRSNFGSVYGFLVGICMVGTIVGPALAGLAYDYWSYKGMWFVFAVLPAAAIFLILSIPPASTQQGRRRIDWLEGEGIYGTRTEGHCAQ